MKRLWRRASHVSWGVADQAVVSAGNFALGVAVAKTVDVREFGAFAIAFTTFSLALSSNRVLSTQPLLVRYSDVVAASWREGASAAVTFSVASGATVACALLGASAFLHGSLARAFAALGLTIPFLLAQDTCRWALHAAGRPRAALLNDACCTAVLATTFGVLVAVNRASMFWLMLAWGLSAACGLLVCYWQAGVVVHGRGAVRWIRMHSDLTSRFFGEFATMTGSNQLILYSVGLFGGLEAIGAMRGAQLALGPLNIFFQSVPLFAVPMAVSRLKAGPHAARTFSIEVSVAMAALAVAWGIALIAVPAGVGELMLGASWRHAQPVILPLSCALAGTGALAGAFVGLRATGSARRSFRAQMHVWPVTLCLGIGGSAWAGAIGAATGLALANAWATGAWWVQLVLEWRCRREERPDVLDEGAVALGEAS